MYFKAPLVIEKTLSDLPSQLASGDDIKRLRAFAQLLPEQISTIFYGYECPLSSDKRWVDLSVRTPMLTSQLNSLIEGFAQKRVSEEIRSSALWSLFFELLREGLHQHFFSRENIGFVWTEFDVGSSPLWPPDPNLYFPAPEVSRLEKVCAKLFGLMKKDEATHLSIASLRRCVEQCLIENLKVTYIGFMLPRTKRGIRLCISNFVDNPDLLERFLKKIGYEQEAKPFVALLKKLSPFIKKANLHLDLEESVKPKLGLECFPQDAPLLERKKKWVSLLDFLVLEGLTTFEKKEGTLSWIGGFKEGLYESELFETTSEDAVSQSSYLQVVRDIHHVKFVYIPENEKKIEAKVYLAVSCTPQVLETSKKSALNCKPAKDQNDFVINAFRSFVVQKQTQRMTDYGEYYHSSGSFYEIYPRNCDEVSQILSLVTHHKIPLRIRGYGHSVNGCSLPQKDELCIRCDQLDRFCFEQENTITIEGGVKVWDLRKFLHTMGFHLTVCNGSYSAPSFGGYISAGGIGYDGDDDALWNIVEEIELVTVAGKIIRCTRKDELFPWLFGSMGQLGYITRAKVKIVPIEGRDYPLGVSGRIQNSDPAKVKWAWFSLMSRADQKDIVLSALRTLERNHSDIWIPSEFFHGSFKYIDFNPPLVYPHERDFVLTALWGSPRSPHGFNLTDILRLERDFHRVVLSDVNFRRYLQAELVPEGFDYRTYFGEKIYAQFLEIKKELDPLMLINRGAVFEETPLQRGVFLEEVRPN